MRFMRRRFSACPPLVALLLSRLPAAGASQARPGDKGPEISRNLRERFPANRPIGSRFPIRLQPCRLRHICGARPEARCIVHAQTPPIHMQSVVCAGGGGGDAGKHAHRFHQIPPAEVRTNSRCKSGDRSDPHQLPVRGKGGRSLGSVGSVARTAQAISPWR